jgi:hypothetical protein
LEDPSPVPAGGDEIILHLDADREIDDAVGTAQPLARKTGVMPP